ncbi:hypothetical protein [Wenzhouxiangella sp. XN79A]|uniref:hypothetical protein n=1 Tax=Wenzhouxiangella sp. XN79A TaxID=2724193 RepID=UPI001981F085|nr:hypothetical protein [Wenzhouxiangella sp. XN79A]
MKPSYLFRTSFLALLLSATFALAQDATLTYQGQLRDAGQPVTGTVNLEFRLFDQLVGGSQIGTAQTRLNWPVEDGLFQVDLNFGAAAFDGNPRFLEVRVNGATLNPRQAVRPSPMALFALGGNEGPAGPPGPQGPQGLQGPSGVVASFDLAGFAGGTISGSAAAYVFVGQTRQVVLAAGQTMIAAAEAALSTSSGVARARIGMCWQRDGMGSLTNFAGGRYMVAEIDTTRTPVGASAQVSGLASGTYTVGFCVLNSSATAINDNDYVNGWVIVTN